MKTPFFSALLISSIFVHWEVYYYLLASDGTAANKIDWIKDYTTIYDFLIQAVLFVALLYLPVFFNSKYQQWLDSVNHKMAISRLERSNEREEKSFINEKTRVDKIYIEKERERSFSTDYDKVVDDRDQLRTNSVQLSNQLSTMSQELDATKQALQEADREIDHQSTNRKELKEALNNYIDKTHQLERNLNAMHKLYSLMRDGNMSDAIFIQSLMKGTDVKQDELESLVGGILSAHRSTPENLVEDYTKTEAENYLRDKINKNLEEHTKIKPLRRGVKAPPKPPQN
ncbi:hypothetical protein L2725_20110 [Shewanella corallii]|uniref:Uncharacterized protein n=1 Tax=Shewanella corallii TaxID=560080 RepID=A0ABT0NC61_9GAMM|nr:hypothetical protein [Shewanella corallii]MCL2916049.1 hypothetical protein [Shewanella corallii]